MSSKHISHSANTSNPLFNCPHALKTHFTQCQHHKPPLQLPPCPQNIFHTVPTPQTPFTTAPMSSKHISPSDNTLKPLFNCRPCPRDIFHPVPTPQTPFSTAPMPTRRISPTSANTSNSLFNSPHALKTHVTHCQHLQPPFQLPPCPQNICHKVPTPQTPFPTAPMPSKHIPHCANTSNPLFNSPHALKTYFTQCQHLKFPFQLGPCPENTFHPMPTPQTPFPIHPMPSKHISHSDNTSNPLFKCPHALKTHSTQCQHLKPPFQLPQCPQNIFHPVPTPQTPFSTAPMTSKHISPSVNTSNPLFNCPHALKTYFTQCQHLKPPFQVPPCPQNTCHPVPTPQTPFQLPPCPENTFNPPVPTPQNPFSTDPMPSKHISPSANTSNPLFVCPHARKMHFTH